MKQKLTDSVETRVARIKAYRAGEYRCNVPPVCTALWDEEAWQNYVTFNDPAISGFIPYNTQNHRVACVKANQ